MLLLVFGSHWSDGRGRRTGGPPKVETRFDCDVLGYHAGRCVQSVNSNKATISVISRVTHTLCVAEWEEGGAEAQVAFQSKFKEGIVAALSSDK